MGAFHALLLILVNSGFCFSARPSIECPLPLQKKDELPTGIALSPNYSLTVRFTDWMKNTSALIRETNSTDMMTIERISRSEVYKYVMGNNSLFHNGTSCSAFTNTSSLPPVYGVPDIVKQTLNIDGFSVSQLITKIKAVSFPQMYNVNSTVVGGIEAIQWVACSSNLSDGSFIQIDVFHSGTTNQIEPYSKNVKNPLVLSLGIMHVSATNQTILNHVSFEVVELDYVKTSNAEMMSIIPHGTFCTDLPVAQTPVKLPVRFEAAFEYVDYYKTSVHDVALTYDGVERIISFQLNAAAESDSPFIGNASMPKTLTSVNVIHDFKFGIEYVLNSDSRTCENIDGINASYGDVAVISAENVLIDMKNASQLLFDTSHSDYYYMGERLSEEGSLFDVYVSRSQPQMPGGAFSVVELLFSRAPWTFDAVSSPFLHSIIHYHLNKSGTEVGRSVIRLHSFRNGSSQGICWACIDVYPCLSPVNDSYLYLHLKDVSMSKLEQVGLTYVLNALRETIAHTSGVSVLRVTNFFLREIKEHVVAFFVISEKSGKTPANTVNRQNETSAYDAQLLLNATLNDHDIVFTVPGVSSKTELRISKQSLGVVPTTFVPDQPPPSSFMGYSGGSMLILAIFMLILGGAIGVGVAFFIYKRQHLSGLAYQVFE